MRCGAQWDGTGWDIHVLVHAPPYTHLTLTSYFLGVAFLPLAWLSMNVTHNGYVPTVAVLS